ncbi:2-hydroxyacyl-CoA dehydratase [Fusibacter sp. 3D3]|uniref:2-hydroxyacyl-CoA dehydratase family protein n=1 Tax=Fusibacter sp. 3D3 TaxID=1048380 RepID=UPI000852C53D|nr:2-hydroxyacyl-CoA dehydratase [Fusibacter sp. 3D3]
MKKIGLTTTVPIEVLIAAGYTPVDLNNLFITSADYLAYIELAEKEGFPKSTCAWTKGIYGACIRHDIKEVIGVVEGDCSNTKALIEVMKMKGIEVYPFAFPQEHTIEAVTMSIKTFSKRFEIDENTVEFTRKHLNKIRANAIEIDQLTYDTHKVTGFENHLLQLCLSDFNGNPEAYEALLTQKRDEISKRQENPKMIRLAYIGVPPMTGDLFDFVEALDARFVYNEVQREFAFPRAGQAKNIYEQYFDYTYPYELDFRIAEIVKQIEARHVHGIIHYTQAFCHRAIEDIVLRDRLKIPMLTIEGDKLNTMDARTKLRVEAFVDMICEIEADK